MNRSKNPGCHDREGAGTNLLQRLAVPGAVTLALLVGMLLGSGLTALAAPSARKAAAPDPEPVVWESSRRPLPPEWRGYRTPVDPDAMFRRAR
ncbi:hypothetical protein [Phenylobacterium sp.]|uniref:hypothetical protein n=1 Tax=Phenylobacterium sp. TaxID=1871053 RepID=UPI00261F5D45|nr:hypothetical protein [Phenylobacterium sp.]